MNEVPLSGRKSRAFSQRHHQPSRLDQIILHTSQKLILHQDWDILSCRKSSSTLGKGESTIKTVWSNCEAWRELFCCLYHESATL